MHSAEFDEAIYAMLVPGVLPEWINWLTFDGCFQDREAPQVTHTRARARARARCQSLNTCVLCQQVDGCVVCCC